jgi:hypothetical protein
MGWETTQQRDVTRRARVTPSSRLLFLVSVLLGLGLLTPAVAAVEISVGGLTAEKVNDSYYRGEVRFETTYMNQSLTACLNTC